MRFDIFFSICQVAVDGHVPDERAMLQSFFEQVRAADELGFGTAWVAESHLSTETQKQNPGAVVPRFEGEIGLNVDFLQFAHRVFSCTRRISVGSAVMNILCNGGPIAAAERVRAFLALHALDEAEARRLEVGFASGRFPYINAPYGIVPRTPVELAAWSAVRPKIFLEATEIFLRLLAGEALSSDDVASGRSSLTPGDCTPEAWNAALRAHGRSAEAIPLEPRWVFPRSRIVPKEVTLDLLGLTIGSHHEEAQRLANTILPTGVFNLSITSPKVLEQTHERMREIYHPSGGPWRRSHMPRTALVFIDTGPGSRATRDARARARAERVLEAYWIAMEGTVDRAKVAEASDNALAGDPDTIAAQIEERFHPEDRLMLWFDFFNHDCAAVTSEMERFMREVAPRFASEG